MLLEATPGYGAASNSGVNVDKVWLDVVWIPLFLYSAGMLEDNDSVGTFLEVAFKRIEHCSHCRIFKDDAFWGRRFGCLLLSLFWQSWDRELLVEAMERQWAASRTCPSDGVHNVWVRWAFPRCLYYLGWICKPIVSARTDLENDR